MNVEINGSPILTTLPIFGGIPLTATLVVTWSIMLLLTLFCIWLTHDLRVDHVTTRQTVAEFLVNTAQNFVDMPKSTGKRKKQSMRSRITSPAWSSPWRKRSWKRRSTPAISRRSLISL